MARQAPRSCKRARTESRPEPMQPASPPAGASPGAVPAPHSSSNSAVSGPPFWPTLETDVVSALTSIPHLDSILDYSAAVGLHKLGCFEEALSLALQVCKRLDLWRNEDEVLRFFRSQALVGMCLFERYKYMCEFMGSPARMGAALLSEACDLLQVASLYLEPCQNWDPDMSLARYQADMMLLCFD